MAPLEILVPAISMESVRAAAQNGADAVYMEITGRSTRKNAKGPSPEEELSEIVSYCHMRGIRVYISLSALLTDRELDEAAGLAAMINRAGVDAVSVRDLGVFRVVRMAAPELAVHASSRMNVHSLEGVRRAAELGISRVALARELSREDIAYICAGSPIETELLIHGAACVCYSGYCHMSAAVGKGSGGRGHCAGLCRSAYGFSGPPESYPLSVKNISLVRQIDELCELGVTSVKIGGNAAVPEYIAAVTRVYAEALKNQTRPSHEEMAALAAFSGGGFTDGYYTGQLGTDMFASAGQGEPSAERLVSTVRATYGGSAEYQRVGIKFYCLLGRNKPAMLAAEDPQGRRVIVEGPVVRRSLDTPTMEAEVKTQLYKTGGTPYFCESVRSHMDPDISVSLADINEMRRKALDKLSAERIKPPKRYRGEFKPGVKYLNHKDPPALTIQVARAEQLHRELVALVPRVTYVPVWEIARSPDMVKPFIKAGLEVCAVLPRVIRDGEMTEVDEMLAIAASIGVAGGLVSNLGHIEAVKKYDMILRGDFGLGVFNSQTVKELKRMGFLSVTASFELDFTEIRELSKGLDVEIIVFGRLPLMITENCVIKNYYGRHACENKLELTDANGANFPIVTEYHCRNVILNSKKLFLADKTDDFDHLGLWGARLLFTTENPRECVQTTESYLGVGTYRPNDYSRGLYC